MKNKNNPFSNREFFKHFFEEHDKAEKLKILQEVIDTINQVMDGEPHSTT